MKKLNKFKKLFLVKVPLLNTKRKEIFKKVFVFIQKKPFTAFFSVLGVFLILLILGNVLFAPKVLPQTNQEVPKLVKIYKLGSAPEVSFQGKIEKSGVIKIVAQMGGVVSYINVSEGQNISMGTNILSLSTNYSGGNVMTISRQIAQTGYETAKSTNQTQKDIIIRQREIADKAKDSGDKIRDITNQSASDTQALFDLNKTIVESLRQNITNLENTNVGGANDTLILQSKQQLTQFQAAMVSTATQSKNLTLQGSSDLSTTLQQYQIALKQLEIQEKAADMNLEISRLQYNLALVSEANMYPSTPFSGTVDKIFVRVGDNVTSGTVLASISGNNQHAKIVVNVSSDIARNISVIEASTLNLGSKTIQLMPSYVSKDATSGVLYSVTYELDDSFTDKLTNDSYVNVQIPIGTPDTSNFDPFIPLDSVVQTQEEAYVYVIDNKNVARVKKITLGQIQGRFVEVMSGLPKNSEIILDRNVIEGDKVKIAR